MLPIAQITGTISAFITFCIFFWVSIDPNSTKAMMRACLFWFSVWVFFYIILRIVSFFQLASREELMMISGFSLVIPLVAVLVELFLDWRVRKIISEEK